MRHANTRYNLIGKRQGRKVVALSFNDQADHVTLPGGMNIEGAPLDQQTVDGGVEPAEIHDIVDMSVNIVVGPSRTDVAENFVGTAGFG